MDAFIVIIASVLLTGEQLLALPLQDHQTGLQLLSKISSGDEELHSNMGNDFDVFSSPVINIFTMNEEKTCFPPVFNNIFIDMGCKSIMFDDFQENRIPQVLSQIKCVSSLPSFRYRSKRVRTTCEEVRYSMPVLYRNGTGDANVFQYTSTIDSVSVACIKSRKTSRIVEKMSPDLVIENVE